MQGVTRSFMKKIVYFAPDGSRLLHIKSLLSKYDDEIIFAAGFLSGAVETARKLVDKGVDVIIARGETAHSIREALPEVIVVTVPISGFDLAIALEQARQYGPNIAVISFPSMIRRVEQLETPLGVKIMKYELPPEPSDETIDAILDTAISAGADVSLGGFTPRLAANRRNFPYIEIPTSDDVYVETFYNSRSLLRSLEQERARNGFIRGILEFAHEGIVSVDAKGDVKLISPVAQKLLGYTPGKGHSTSIKDVFPKELQEIIISGQKVHNKIVQLKKKQVLCNKTPVMHRERTMGAVITFQEIGSIQNMENHIRKEIYAKGHIARYSFDTIYVADKKTREILQLAQNIAKADANVVVLGETGVGKEVFAQSIHHASGRSAGPFVAVNCAALPASLLESELFGYVEGAFTGAKKEGKQGFFEIAHKGTLFLDEIAELNYGLQGRLLRVLQERSIIRLGSDRVVPVDVRVIAATHGDLQGLVRKGVFREDLYYRLNILNLRLPPLRERRKDIPLYAKNFADECSRAARKHLVLSPGALRYLAGLDWPGNIRELRNMMERLAALTTREYISAAYLKTLLCEAAPQGTENLSPARAKEKLELLAALEAASGDLEKTAELLCISRVTLWRRLRNYAINRKEYR